MEPRDIAMMKSIAAGASEKAGISLDAIELSDYGLTFDDGATGDASIFNDIFASLLNGRFVVISGTSNTFGATFSCLLVGYQVNKNTFKIEGASVVGCFLTDTLLMLSGVLLNQSDSAKLHMSIGPAPTL